MLIVNKSTFSKGAILLISFLGILLLIFSEIFPVGDKKVNGLDYADDLFNRLAKGSSFFIPEVRDQVKAIQGKDMQAAIKLKKAENADKVAKLAAATGVQATAKDGSVSLSGDLGKLESRILTDSEAMYKNDNKALESAYGMDARFVMESWWEINAALIKELQKNRQFAEAKVVDVVNKKGIEPAYNFYGVQAESITSKAFTAAGLLAFYVVYTMWYGFAIFDLFNGIGLTMKKSKVKKEV